MATTGMSGDEARRVALAAQGFDRARPRRVHAGHLGRTIRRLGLLQIDYVNVLVPSHYLVLFSRLGPYDRSRFDDVVYRRGGFTEQWAHEASIVPVETWPLLRHRMDAHRVRPYGFETFMHANPAYANRVVDEVRLRGPLTAADLPLPENGPHRIPGAWFGSVPRAVLEAHFGRGVLGVASRRGNFARAYDLAERVIPAEHFERRVLPDEARRKLLLDAGRALGVGTAADLADYYRMSVREARPRIEELREAGELEAVRVDGWREVAYLHRDASRPGRIAARAILSPFDPVVWFRARTSRLFGFEYRFEIFVPEAKRRWGCYVLPFLLDDALVARVDVKSDRQRNRLLIVSAHLEAGAEGPVVAGELAQELLVLAGWLGFATVTVGRKGNLARLLSSEVRRRPKPALTGPDLC
jgi:uncharacterized protein YcaQ